MNIFVLDNDIDACARAHCDRHVVKMILESAQMLCTCLHETGYNGVIPYKKSHVNHPCNRWLRDSLSNWRWLRDLVIALNNEYKYRYNKYNNHKSYDVVMSLPEPDIPDIGLTRWARAMPDECKVNNDVIESYRTYYRTNKQHLHKWTNRSIPVWL